jgi:prophage antirepressor-like protein
MQELIKSFDFNGHGVRIITNENNQVFFVAKDICEVLGYSNTSKAISDNCKNEGITTSYIPHPQSETKQIEVTVINEANLYRLVMRSNKKEAIDFQDWVCDEVLPSIRKTGKYDVKEISTTKTPSYLIEDEIERAKIWIVEAEERKQLQESNEKLQFRSDFVDVCFNTDGMFSMEETVKILKLPFGRNDMMKKLREKKVLTLSNTPIQKHISNGYFKVIESVVEHGTFKKLIQTTYATQKGIGYIHKLFSNENDTSLAIAN